MTPYLSGTGHQMLSGTLLHEILVELIGCVLVSWDIVYHRVWLKTWIRAVILLLQHRIPRVTT
jgi:hypothetical protein